MNKLKGNRKLAIVFVLLTIISMVYLFAESSEPPSSFIGKVYGLDKFAHFIAFLILGMLVSAAHVCATGSVTIPLYFKPFLILILFGVAQEGGQMTNPNRKASFGDLFADFSGIMFSRLLINRSLLVISSKSKES
ncbi:VanZ family protein [Methylomonas sp. TEB]|uniref:VanZ family protein n=1 Tax=Methylomonas sp. TEB TaxID=3398229 RepID=UPI0039F46A4F